jgi:hypothetical protein
MPLDVCGSLTEALCTLPSRPGLLVAKAVNLDVPGRDLPGEIRREIDRLQSGFHPDGSVDRDLLTTAWQVQQLLDLGVPTGDPAVRNGVRWLCEQQGTEGAFGQGCTPERHRHHVCEHFVASFFSPARSTTRIAPLTFPWGRTMRSEAAARFAVSCVALQVVLRAGAWNRSVERHLDSFPALQREWERWGGFLPPDLAFSTLGCLARSPAHLPHTEALLATIAGRQEADGSWPVTDPFHALVGLLPCRDHPVAKRCLEALAPFVGNEVRPDGLVGGTAGLERSWLAWDAWCRPQGTPSASEA